MDKKNRISKFSSKNVLEKKEDDLYAPIVAKKNRKE